MEGEIELSSVLGEFARTMVTDFPIQAILDRLVERIVEVLPITAAGVTLISASAEPRYLAASNSAALRFEKLQTELGEGPCLEAYRTGEAVVIMDVANDGRFSEFVRRAVEEGLAAVFTFPLRHGEGQLGALDLYRDTAGSLDDEAMQAAQTLADVASAYLLNAQARSDLFESNARFRDSALHDGLTGLPNRVLFLERLEHALTRCGRSGKLLAVLFADLDKFKVVNDVHGHQIGDELLVAVAARLGGAVRPSDTVGRLSGDEFVILCEDLEEISQVDSIAARIDREMRVPFVVSGTEVQVTASTGIVFFGDDDHIPEEVLHHADTAMYRAKRSGGARHEIVDLRGQPEKPSHGDLSYDLAGAVARHELRLVYQPIVATKSALPIGLEALVRWAHPTRGTVGPGMFLPLAERSGLINEIGRWVLDHACGDRASWAGRDQLETLGMSLNVSVHQVMAPGFAAAVGAVLIATSIPPSALTLEITESVLIQDGQRALTVLNDLKSVGVQLALDDFGTGYSSLSHLHRFPIDAVKIDRSFVADLTTDSPSHAIVEAVIDLCHTMGLTVTAEGVETAEQLRHLAALGCDACQGYHFARPMPADNLGGWLRTNASS